MSLRDPALNASRNHKLFPESDKAHGTILPLQCDDASRGEYH